MGGAVFSWLQSAISTLVANAQWTFNANKVLPFNEAFRLKVGYLTGVYINIILIPACSLLLHLSLLWPLSFSGDYYMY